MKNLLTEKTKGMPLSGNALKLFAAFAMLCDHTGLIFFPDVMWWRIIGRFAFPIFAFFIAEGCRYTRNRPRYLLVIFLLAVFFQLAYSVVSEEVYLSIFVTFTLGIALVYLFDNFKRTLYSPQAKRYHVALSALCFLLALAAVYELNQAVLIDYGFFGCITPLFVSIPHATKDAPSFARIRDNVPASALAMCVPLVGLSLTAVIPVQYYCLAPVLLLLFYSGKRGKYKMKYFFYLFYPLHLVLLYGVAFLLYV